MVGFNKSFLFQINVKDLNFRRMYEEVSELDSDENCDLFPPPFIIEIMCKDRSCMLHVPCEISCYDKTKNADLFFKPGARQPQAGARLVS